MIDTEIGDGDSISQEIINEIFKNDKNYDPDLGTEKDPHYDSYISFKEEIEKINQVSVLETGLEKKLYVSNGT